jgi:DNA-binding beta-propeller fold protein YncE
VTGLTRTLVLLACLMLLGLILGGCGEQKKQGVSRSATGLLVEPFNGEETDVPRRPVSVTTGGGAVWVTSMAGGVLTKADPKTGKQIGKPTDLNDGPFSVLYAFGKVWATTFQRSRLYRVNPKTSKVIGFTKVGNRPFGIAAGFDSLWVTSIRDETLSRIDPNNGKRIGRPIPLSGTPFKVTTGFGYVWVTNIRDGLVDRIDPKTNRRAGTPIRITDRTCNEASIAKSKKFGGKQRNEMVTNCGSPAAIVAAGKYIWVSNVHGEAVKDGEANKTKIKQGLPNGDVWRIDPKTAKVVGSPIKVPMRPVAMAADADSLWVAGLEAGTLLRIDLHTATRDKLPINVEGGPADLAVGFDKLWIALSKRSKLGSMSTSERQ